MPQIKEYDLKTAAASVPAVQEASPQQFGRTGVGMQNLAEAGFQLADVLRRRQEQAEVSDLHAKLSEKQAEWTQEYQDQLQKGTLDTEQFSKDFSDDMSDMSEDISTRAGRNFFTRASATLKAHFLDKAAVGQAELAGAKAKTDYMSSLGNATSTLINDPSSFDTTLQLQTSGIDGLVEGGGLPAKAAEELKSHTQTELAKSAIRGWIKLDPQDASKQINDGKWDQFIDGDLKHQMLGEAKQGENAARIEDERIRKQQADAAAAVQESTVQGFITNLNDEKGAGLSTKDVITAMQQNKIDSPTAEHWLKVIDNYNQDRKVKSDPATMRDLTRRLTLADGSPEKITDMGPINQQLSDGKLSIPDANLLMGLLAEKHTPQGEADSAMKQTFFKTMENRVMKGVPGMPDPEGWNIYGQVQSQSLQYALDAAKKGKSQTQIWAPTIGGKENPDYVGNHVSVPQRDMNDVVKSTIDRLDKTAAQPKNTVEMILPSGARRYIPKDRIEDAKKLGAKEAGK